ncbi:hypothetical protein BT69DRAFT_1295480 [Atractiella rhizophila]|nr:hypothetical protein BT69DRAFT_1295480 [Atractiella rhizophila]
MLQFGLLFSLQQLYLPVHPSLLTLASILVWQWLHFLLGVQDLTQECRFLLFSSIVRCVNNMGTVSAEPFQKDRDQRRRKHTTLHQIAIPSEQTPTPPSAFYHFNGVHGSEIRQFEREGEPRVVDRVVDSHHEKDRKWKLALIKGPTLDELSLEIRIGDDLVTSWARKGAEGHLGSTTSLVCGLSSVVCGDLSQSL